MWYEPFSLRLASPLGTARGPIEERRGFLVGVDHAGACGLGEATPLPGWTESYDDCRRALATHSEQSSTPPDPTATPAAAHAVELAELDARGQHENVPLATLLRTTAFGADSLPIPESVPVNATIGNGSVDETVTTANRAVRAGYDCLKLKVGVDEPERDIRRVRTVRTAVGDEITIRVDANGAWDRPTAARLIDRFATLDIEYVEQPLPAADLSGHRQLRSRGVQIAVDESLTTYAVGDVINERAADVVVLKPMALGGPLQAIHAAATARSAGVEPVVTTTIDGVVGRTAAVHVAAAIPDVSACGLATASLLADDLAADPVSISEGAASVPTGGGLCGTGFAPLRRS